MNVPMTTEVVVVGAGPTGLMLACELALAGVRPMVLDRLPEASGLPKANGLVGQVVQMLDYRGLLERFSEGTPFVGPVPAFQFGAVSMDLGSLGTSPLHILPIPQARLEELLAERAHKLGVQVRWGHEVTALSQDEDAVTLDVHRPEGDYQLSARYLVGCDGAHSLVRKQAGIDFPGVTYDKVSRIGHVALPSSMIVPETGELELPGVGRLRPGHNRTEHGVFSFMSLKPGVHVVAAVEKEEPPVDLSAPMTLQELRDSACRVLGVDLPMSEPRWLSRNVGNSRQADRYRSGRVLLAGDAAHVLGAGGSALNLGLLDAVNLGWKLAADVRFSAPPGLLDTYGAERHPVGERTLMHTRAQTALMASGEDATALRELFGELLRYGQPLRHVAELLAGADIRYDTRAGGPPHPMAGRWMPDLALRNGNGPTRVAELLRAARPVLLDLTGRDGLVDAAKGWLDRVDAVTATAAERPADAVLIRPDGYVAWATGPDGPGQEAGHQEAGQQARDGLRHALTTWFGAPSAG